MKHLLLSITVIGTLLTSCANNGKKAKTDDAQEVKAASTENATLFNTVKEDSYLDWRASHLGGAQPRYGKVFVKEAKVSVTNGKIVNATAIIDMASLTVESFPEGAEEIAKLKGHLQSPDFFNVENYPTSKFELTNVEQTEGEYNSKVTGNLTIMETTKSITFNANVSVSEEAVSIESEDFSVDRTDWNLTYNVEGSKVVPVDYLIANSIGFTIHATVTK